MRGSVKLSSDSPVVVDKAVLHVPSQTLRVHAHAKAPLEYAQYRSACENLRAQAGAIHDAAKAILLRNSAADDGHVVRFCAEAFADMCNCATHSFSIEYAANEKCISVILASNAVEECGLDEGRKDAFSALVKTCFNGIAVRFAQKPHAEKDRAHEKASAPQTRAPGKRKRAAATQGKDKNKTFLPSVKRKAVFGNRFSPRKLDAISHLTLESGRVSVMGRVLELQSKPTRQNDAFVMLMYLSDSRETVLVKWMATPKEQKLAMRILLPGAHAGVAGALRYDARFAKENIIWAEKVTWFDMPGRTDDAQTKRIELHAHTKMSMDGVADAKQLVATAARYGHPAIAITDHGVVQAFPDAYTAAQDAKRAGMDIKLIYGVEAYLANDCPYEGPDAPADEYIVVDIETTGLNPMRDELLEIGAVRVKGRDILDSFSTFVRPQNPIPSEIVRLTGIDDSMVADAPDAQAALSKLLAFVKDAPIAAHNAWFDLSFLRNVARRHAIAFDNGVLDSLTLARLVLPQRGRHNLAALVRHFGIPLQNHHRAKEDAAATAEILIRLMQMAKPSSMCALNGVGDTRAVPHHHAILLVKNQQGLRTLYELITQSHLQHFHRRPVLPKSLLAQHREHLLVGSGCQQGEIFQSVMRGEDADHQRALAAFNDYLEIQPIENNLFLIDDAREGRNIKSEEDLWDINRRILQLGGETGLPVVATGDVHFIDPEDECYRRILLDAQGYEDAQTQPPLFLHTTKEMLLAFSTLGEEAAAEVVIHAPARIAAQIDGNVAPFPADAHLPHEQGGEQEVVRIAMEGAKAVYGPKLPDVVERRLNKELQSICKHGFEVLYLSAHRLVTRSVQDGYTVGSRGSVGSSFAAFAMGISEINPLPAHYRCPQCQLVDFDVASSEGQCGPDLPERRCPRCGAELDRDGFDIPFEVFLGFDGDKVPDIDLNFSGEYQEKAFAYVEKMFGAENVFRAGTVVGIQEKSAYGYVLKHLENQNTTASRAQINRFAQGIKGVKRTTGQHPGGLIVLPGDMDIHAFTPLQRPADRQDSPVITTHFDFNSLHDRLVKLDILGHDNPTMIRRLLEFTGVDPLTVPLNDAATLSLFSGTEALGLDEKALGIPTGTLGIPEFGTDFVISMLVDTQPKTIAELLQISGLSHGTDVWLGNAQELIQNGIATLAECICTRDNIMNYLLSKGVEPRLAFNTMERVRKGNGLTAEMEQAMRASSVPAWFIQSCKKIKYMFPKAHAAAYVLSALRIGYFKVHHPLAYYAAYFSVRGEEMDAVSVLGGVEGIDRRFAQMNKKQEKSTRDDKERMHLAIAREMLLRGFEFLAPDLEKSHVRHYLCEDGKLRLPFTSVSGLGESAARSIEQARAQGAFCTVEDLKSRTKLNTAVIEKLRELGSLSHLPDTAQISFFQIM